MNLMHDGDMTTALMEWYARARRDLPWRRTHDPYAIWVSETMLQQTRVDTAIPYFLRFMERFPHIRSLAHAHEDDVLALWAGLGYYARARALHRAAQYVSAQHQGVVPADYAQFAALPGVGAYTAGAVMSIAYGLPYAAIDANVLRVCARIHAIEDDITRTKTKQRIAQLQLALLPPHDAGTFNQAMMELGALICTARSPQCGACPVRSYCRAHAHGRTGDIPYKKAKKNPRSERRCAIVCIREDDGRILMRQRGASGLLLRMWELPHVSLEHEEEPMPWSIDGAINPQWQAHVGIARLTHGTALAMFVHRFTHRIWQMDVVVRHAVVHRDAPSPYAWVDEQQRASIAVAALFDRIVASVRTDHRV
jgi:A/G-specific adenine glycosylase